MRGRPADPRIDIAVWLLIWYNIYVGSLRQIMYGVTDFALMCAGNVYFVVPVFDPDLDASEKYDQGVGICTMR